MPAQRCPGSFLKAPAEVGTSARERVRQQAARRAIIAGLWLGLEPQPRLRQPSDRTRAQTSDSSTYLHEWFSISQSAMPIRQSTSAQMKRIPRSPASAPSAIPQVASLRSRHLTADSLAESSTRAKFVRPVWALEPKHHVTAARARPV